MKTEFVANFLKGYLEVYSNLRLFCCKVATHLGLFDFYFSKVHASLDVCP